MKQLLSALDTLGLGKLLNQFNVLRNRGLVFLMVTIVFSTTAFSQGCPSCALGYPDNSNLPKSAVEFNENELFAAMSPSATNCVLQDGFIKAWYRDEHALSLGFRSVIVKKANGTTYTKNYPVTATPTSPTCATALQLGATGDDGNDLNGIPERPVLYITDLTVNGSTSRAGDWQQGGTPHDPTAVCGTWKAIVKNVDSTHNPAKVTITADNDPAKNQNWALGGGDAPPPGTQSMDYGAEVKWAVSSLGLIEGHSYRIQVIIHDGDHATDIGSMCTTISVPVSTHPDLTPRITLNPNNIIGQSNMEITVQVNELNNANTNGSLITLYVDKLSMFSNFSYNSARTTNQAGQAVQNNIFTVDAVSNPDFYVITTNAVFANSLKRLVFTVHVNPGQTKGATNVNVFLNNGSGGETNFNNNNDLTTLTFSF